MSTFNERLRYAASLSNLTQTDLCKKTGIPKSAMSQYFSGSFKPKDDRTFILAKALNVSEAWLMGYDVPMNNDSELLVQIYNSLNEDNKKKLLELARLYANSNNNKD